MEVENLFGDSVVARVRGECPHLQFAAKEGRTLKKVWGLKSCRLKELEKKNPLHNFGSVVKAPAK